MDNKYYCAVSYFGIEGISFDQLVLSDEKWISGKEEESKIGFEAEHVEMESNNGSIIEN